MANMISELFVTNALGSRCALLLIHSLWQCLLIVCVLVVVGLFVKRSAVELQYRLWLAGFLVSLLALPVTFLTDPMPTLLSPNSRTHHIAGRVDAWEDREVIPSQAWGTSTSHFMPTQPNEALAMPAPAVEAPLTGTAATSPQVALTTNRWNDALQWLLIGYAVGVSIMLTRLFRGMTAAQRLRHDAQPVSHGECLEIFSRLIRTMKLRTTPVLASSQRVLVPRVIGLLRPVVLVPTSVLTGLTAAEIEMLLVHELAHLRRYDMWVNLLQRLAETVLFFNPGIWVMSRQLSRLREYCCDDDACGSLDFAERHPPTLYAKTLLQVAQLGFEARGATRSHLLGDQGDLATLAAIGRSPSELRRRIVRLIGEPYREPLVLSRRLLWSCGLGVAMFLTGPLAWQLVAQEAVQSPSPDVPAVEADHDDAEDDADDQPVVAAAEPARLDVSVVIARHVLLLEGREIVTWDQLDEMIGNFPDPAIVYPHFYFSTAVHSQPKQYEDAKLRIWNLHKKYSFQGHSEGSLWPRINVYYDAIETAADLQPNPEHRIVGTVVDQDQRPVSDAEVLLITPIHESIGYRSYHIALVEGRVRNRLEHLLRVTDEDGQFECHPDPQQPYSLLVVHPIKGFRLVDKMSFLSEQKIPLTPWSGLVVHIDDQGGEQSVDLNTTIAASDARPEIVINQYWSDRKVQAPAGAYSFKQIPAIYPTGISRSLPQPDGGSYSLNAASVSLLPNETRHFGIGPISKQQLEQLESIKNLNRQIRKQQDDSGDDDEEADDPAEQQSAAQIEADKWLELFVRDAAGQAVLDAEVEFRGGPLATADQFPVGTFLREGPYGVFVKPDKFGRVVFTPGVETEGFSLSIKARGHGPYHARYSTKNWPADAAIRLVAELEPGWSIGGRVIDEDGNPVQDADVRPWIEYKKAPGMTYQLGAGARRRTDKDGRWSLHIVPDSLKELRVEIHHPNFKPESRSLTRTEFEIQSTQQEFQSIPLSRGIVVTGRVTDSQGRPITGALVRSKFANDVRQATTDADGKYELVGCETGKSRVVVSAPGKATDMREVQITESPDPVNFEMQPGGHVRIVVQDADGNPIPKARIFYQDWRGGTDYFEFDFKDQYADENGVWEWNEAPLDEFFVDVCRPGGMQLSDQRIVARPEEYLFSPPPALVVTGKVLDAKTSKPIKTFRVTPGVFFGNDPHPLNGDAFEGANGRYQVKRHDGYDRYFVRIDAPGYLAQQSRPINPDEGRIDIDFQLQPASVLTTRVLQADGQPARQAQVAVGIPGTRIRIENAEFDRINTDCLIHSTDNNGHFQWTAHSGDVHLVVLHESGFVHLHSETGQFPDTCKLTPWASVEGTFQVGEQLQPNVRLTLSPSSGWISERGQAQLDVSFSTRTGEAGQFEFPRVIPGTAMITSPVYYSDANSILGNSQKQMPIESVAGESRFVKIGGDGTRVSGQLVLPENFSSDVAWNRVRLELTSIAGRPNKPSPPPSVQGDPAAEQAWFREWLNTVAGQQYRLDSQAYREQLNRRQRIYATPDNNGRFQFVDVPPGEYELSDWGFFNMPFRFPSRQVNVPDASPVNVGTLQPGQPQP